MPTLHLHLDEAGNWVFGPKGTKYWIMTVAWTMNPKPLSSELVDLRFSFVRNGIDIEGFHAAPDRQEVRDAVVKSMLRHSDWSFASIVVEKCKVNPALHEPSKFYPRFASAVLRFVMRSSIGRAATNLLVYADTLPLNTHKKREGVTKAIKAACSAELPTRPHQFYSHCHESNAWIQVVDYCCWAVQRKWEKGDDRTYRQLLPRLAKTELVLTDRGDGTRYY